MSLSAIVQRIQGILSPSTSSNAAPHPNTPSSLQASDDELTLSTASTVIPASDRRVLEKTLKYVELVVRNCKDKRLGLKNSPPYILDIVPETYQYILSIFSKSPKVLQENYFLQIFIHNFIDKCKQTGKLFKSGTIYDPKSPDRRHLTRLSLIYSHLLFELKAVFPGAVYIGSNFQFTKKEAGRFWKESFGIKTCIPWSTFIDSFNKVHPVTKGDMLLLKETIDLTGNDHISNFEFDVFTRLFYPWNDLISNWTIITSSHPGYVAFLTYDEVKKRLEAFLDKPGSYLFRLSCTRLGQWAIGYVAPDKKIYQTIPQNKSLIQALYEGSREGFYLYPNGQDKDVDLSLKLVQSIPDRVQVTSEQYQIYSEMGTTFELCKICDDANKDIKMEPCGHLICLSCLTNWQKSETRDKAGQKTCPFCRVEIKGTSHVIIDKFCTIPKFTNSADIKVRSSGEGYNQEKRESLPSYAAPMLPPMLPPKTKSPRPTPSAPASQKRNSEVLQQHLPSAVSMRSRFDRSTRRSNSVREAPTYVNIREMMRSSQLPNDQATMDALYVNADVARNSAR